MAVISTESPLVTAGPGRGRDERSRWSKAGCLALARPGQTVRRRTCRPGPSTPRPRHPCRAVPRACGAAAPLPVPLPMKQQRSRFYVPGTGHLGAAGGGAGGPCHSATQQPGLGSCLPSTAAGTPRAASPHRTLSPPAPNSVGEKAAGSWVLPSPPQHQGSTSQLSPVSLRRRGAPPALCKAISWCQRAQHPQQHDRVQLF